MSPIFPAAPPDASEAAGDVAERDGCMPGPPAGADGPGALGMLPLETLIRAAEGGEREADLVRADFEKAGLARWLRAAIERRLDPALGARVVPAGASAAVSGALVAFYALWGRWYPSEYRRMRREWVVLQARWRGDALLEPAATVDPVTSRLLGEVLGAPPAEVAIPAEGANGAATGRELSPAPGGESGREGDGSEAAGDRESPGGGPASLVSAGGPVPARLPDGTEILADTAAGLALSAVGDRFDRAVLGGVAAVEQVRAAWLSGSGAWRQWPASGWGQERSR